MSLQSYFVILLGLGVCLPAAPPQKSDAYAKMAVGAPLKLRIRPAVSTVRRGQKVELVVAVQDGEGRPARIKQDLRARITVTEPSGKVVVLSEKISAGKDSDTQSYTPTAVGRYVVEAKDQSGQLLSDKYSFLVLAASSVPRKTGYVFPPVGWIPQGFAAKPAPPEPDAATARRSSRPKPRLFLELLARDEGVLADSVDCATIRATYVGEDGQSPAPVDVKVWMRRSHGELDRQLTIPKGQNEGKSCWTSEWPVKEASIELVSAGPGDFAKEGPTKFKTQFVQRVDGIVVDGPRDFSLVEKPSLRVHFVDHLGKMIKPDKKRTVSFTVKNTGVTVSPQEMSIGPDDNPQAAILSPVSPGKASIQVASAGLRNGLADYSADVTIGWVIALVILGGLGGGGLSYLKSPSMPGLKFGGGVAGGFVLTAAYVFGMVPALPVLPLNSISAMASSLVGGWAGTGVLDWAWGSMKGKAATASPNPGAS